jgi:hypothetical protein
MAPLLILAKWLPVLVATGALADINLPPIPKDRTTPVQQRIAIGGPNGEFEPPELDKIILQVLFPILAALY